MMGGAILVAALLAQAPPAFGVGVEEVRVDVSVTRRGTSLGGLVAEDFVLKDNGVPQRVELVDRTATPTTLVLVLDRSASVSGRKLETLRSAARAFSRELRPQDEAAVLVFDHRIELLCPAGTDRAALSRALDSPERGGASSVIDALYLALKRQWGTGLPLVVLFTDGQDTASWLENETVVSAARESPVLLHVVATESRALRFVRSAQGVGFSPTFADLGANGRPGAGLTDHGSPPASEEGSSGRTLEDVVRAQSGYVSLLRRVAEITGGAYWAVDSDEHMEATFRRVLEAANGRYVLRYEPQGVERRGLHRLEVSVRRRGVDVRARREYSIPN